MWIYLIAILIGLCYASLLYLLNKRQHYSKTLTVILFVLRTVVVSIVVLLFFNPFFKHKTNKIEQSTIIVAQDNSSSLILTKDSVFYQKKYPQRIDSLLHHLEKNFHVDKYLFGNEVRDYDVIDYKDHYTDIYEILNVLKRSYYKKNVGAVILLSDGIYNKGYAPEQNLESYPFPIYTLTLGDTINYPDFFIKNVRYNKTTPSNTYFPLQVIVNAQNCRDKKMNVTVSIDNETMENVTIPISSNRFSKTLDFNIKAESEGVKQIDIQIAGLPDEVRTKNNHKRFFIEVIDKQYKVLFYANAPHPDLGCLKNIMGNHFEIETIFSNDEIPDLRDYDLLVLHQVPYLGMDNLKTLEKELENNKNIPVFYIVGERTDFEAFNKLQQALCLKQGTVKTSLDIKPHYNRTFGLFTIDNEIKEIVNNFPPLSLPHIELIYNTHHDDLLFMNIMDIVTQTPLISFTVDNDGRKMACLLGTGIWRWKLYDYYQHKNYNGFEEIMTKSIKYLLTEKDKELIVNYRENYLNNETIKLTAELKNPSRELITEPDLYLRLINKYSKDIYEYVFSKDERNYRLNTGTLPEGVYTFDAHAEFGGKLYKAQGTFSVVSVGAEAQNLVANAKSMHLIASQTKGENFNINQLNQLVEHLKNDKRITSVSREETRYEDLIHWKSLFFIILALITIEWILRKMFGTY